MKDIASFKRSYIELSEIEEFFGMPCYKELCSTIGILVNENKLRPVITQGKNGKNPSLYMKYKIIKEKEDTDEIRKEIINEFPPVFSIDYYSSNPEKYIKHRDYLLKLCDYFKYKRDAFNTKMSINERSFDIFENEKLLKNDSEITSILSNIKVYIDDLNIYKTPEPFFSYSKSRISPQNILIIENKDTWYTFRQLMREGQTVFLGKEFHTVIYGEGKKIISSLFDIDEGEDEYLKDEKNNFSYFGDLDLEGVMIYEELRKRNAEVRNIELFKEAYVKMVELSNGRNLREMKKGQNKSYVQDFLTRFDKDASLKMMQILYEGLYVPQEILSYAVLREEKI